VDVSAERIPRHHTQEPQHHKHESSDSQHSYLLFWDLARDDYTISSLKYKQKFLLLLSLGNYAFLISLQMV